MDLAAPLGVDLVVVPAPANPEGATAAAAGVLAAADRPSAVFCLSDSLAFGVYRAAADLRLRVPDDVSVVGFDDHQLAALVDPALTTVSWDEDAIVAAAVEQLLALQEHGPGAGSRDVPPAPRRRGSTR